MRVLQLRAPGCCCRDSQRTTHARALTCAVLQAAVAAAAGMSAQARNSAAMCAFEQQAVTALLRNTSGTQVGPAKEWLLLCGLLHACTSCTRQQAGGVVVCCTQRWFSGVEV